MQWRPLLPKEGGLIQVDIDGHPPFPTGSKQFSGNFGNLLFLAVFNFRGHFEGLNEGFSGILGQKYSFMIFYVKIVSPRDTLSNGLSCT
jgi:hypothetical protein